MENHEKRCWLTGRFKLISCGAEKYILSVQVESSTFLRLKKKNSVSIGISEKLLAQLVGWLVGCRRRFLVRSISAHF